MYKSRACALRCLTRRRAVNDCAGGRQHVGGGPAPTRRGPPAPGRQQPAPGYCQGRVQGACLLRSATAPARRNPRPAACRRRCGRLSESGAGRLPADGGRPGRAQVSKARDHVESGVTHLVEAKKMQKKTRKLMCCILVTVIVVVALIVILVVKPWTLVNKQ
jgi:hypothetical protein